MSTSTLRYQNVLIVTCSYLLCSEEEVKIETKYLVPDGM
jgi:hypothetical protein